MHPIQVPSAGSRYWVALSIASIFGANTGDFIARYLHLGHAGGLPALAVLAALIFLVERRDRTAHQGYYWGAIIVVRTAATNLADFGASDMHLGHPWLIVGLTALLVAILALMPPAKPAGAPDRWPFSLPMADARYWTAMLVAGTLGTALGDFGSFDTRIGTLDASLIEGVLLLTLILFGRTGPLAGLWYYWLVVVAVRTAGTSFGDFLAHDVFGLALSTLVTGLIFIGTLIVWREPTTYRVPSGAA
jgi:uncharacterized membrane-anchored protein